MDLVTVCKKAAIGGETIFGKDFFNSPGGKGANQAVAISKMGSNTYMLGMVGADYFGKQLKNNLKANGINVDYVATTDKSTGIANIIVEENGQNRIIVVAGANNEVDIKFIQQHETLIAEADIIVTQLEIPLESVSMLLALAKKHNKLTLLNPAPAQKLSDDITKNVDYLMPNETELEILTDVKIESEADINKAATLILNKGIKNLIVTLGEKGARLFTTDKVTEFQAYRVKAIDTTAAGDSFIGGFIRTLANDRPIHEAIEFGMKVAAITVTRQGAQDSIPSLEEVCAFKGENYEKN